jgi:hypothetical protein
MKRLLYFLLSLFSFFVCFQSLRLSLPIFEIKQILDTRKGIIESGIDLSPGGVFISKIYDDSPMSQAGIENNSQITYINGASVKDTTNFIETIQNNLEKEVILTVCKYKSCKNIHVVPRKTPPSGQESLGINIIDISLFGKSVPQIIVEQFYVRYAGQDIYSTLFGRKVLVLTYATLLVGIASFVIGVKLIKIMFRK